MKDSTNPKSRGGLAPDKYLDGRERDRLLKHVKSQADKARALGHSRPIIDELVVHLLDGTGLRANELCSLNLEDLPCCHKKDLVFVRNGKGNVRRTVIINPELSKRLNAFARQYRKGAKPNKPLLLNERGNRFSYVSLYSKITRIGDEVGLELHPHMLRHTYATRLYNIEKDLFFTQDQLGHASPVTTQIYAKTDNASKRRQVSQL